MTSEIAALCRGPKYCVRRVLDEERFLMDCEKSCFKLRIEMYDNDIREDDLGGGVKESEEDRIERERVEKMPSWQSWRVRLSSTRMR